VTTGVRTRPFRGAVASPCRPRGAAVYALDQRNDGPFKLSRHCRDGTCAESIGLSVPRGKRPDAEATNGAAPSRGHSRRQAPSAKRRLRSAWGNIVSGTGDAATNVADLLSDIRRDIARRLDELRPVRDEFRRLEQARDALAKANDARRPARASKANDGSARTRMTRTQSQEIDKRVLALLAEDSAQRPAALAMLTKTSVGSMNARLNRLVRDGELKKSKRGNTIRYQVPPGGDRDGH